ncbi:MAG: FtsW/RodA/SpoVE family cell cycle protein [Candidatus Ryanbacteria bacterium]|nr:FtsW/RodA/SpoVE family cell cycle protein [Candidatus Ryanbacteria bacterium]
MKGVDRVLFWTVVSLVALGLLILASASIGYSIKRFGHPYYYLLRQIILGVGGGTILFWVGLRMPVSVYRRFAPQILIAGIILIGVALVQNATPHLDARRWIFVGQPPFQLSFQPSEILKFGLVVYIAAWICAKRKELSTFTLGFLPFLLITGFAGIFLYAEPDIGTLGVVTMTALGIFLLGGGRTSQVALAVLLGVVVLGVIIYAEPYRRDRLFIFLNPDSDTQGAGYQINQARIAIGSGGLFGKGLGLSRQKYSYLPEPMGDSIFAVFAEEFGFLGVAVLIFGFLFFFFRGMLTAARAYDSFAQLLASGLTLLIITQVAINIGSLSGLLPLTGIPLPFISYGGTALASTLFEMGILLNISKRKTL